MEFYFILARKVTRDNVGRAWWGLGSLVRGWVLVVERVLQHCLRLIMKNFAIIHCDLIKYFLKLDSASHPHAVLSL